MAIEFSLKLERKSMTRVATSVVINRPPEEVFEFVSNFENNPRWQSGMHEARITSEGPLGVGTTYSHLLSFWVAASNPHLKLSITSPTPW
jgi:uncharacterized membrane protein